MSDAGGIIGESGQFARGGASSLPNWIHNGAWPGGALGLTSWVEGEKDEDRDWYE